MRVTLNKKKKKKDAHYVMNKDKQLYKNYKLNKGNWKMYNQKRALSNLKKVKYDAHTSS